MIEDAPFPVAPAVLLAGASGNLGREIAVRLRAAGARVTLVARSRESLARLYPERAADLLFLGVDLTKDSAAAAIVSRHMRRFGRLDAVVHAAGESAHGQLGVQPDEEIQRLVSINLLAPIRLTKAALDPLRLTARRTGFASNVYVGSIAAAVHPADQAVYTAAKSGLVGFSLALHKQLASQGVECVVVSPGSLSTVQRSSEKPSEQLLDPAKVAKVVASFALGRRSTERHVIVHAPAWAGAADSGGSTEGTDDGHC